MSKANQFHNRYIDDSYLEEKSKFGYNPWSVLVEEAIIQEGSKMQDVSSDDEPEGLDKNEAPKTPASAQAEIDAEQAQAAGQEGQPSEEEMAMMQQQAEQEAAAGQEGAGEAGEAGEAGLLSPEELQQLIEGFQTGEVTEETLKQMLDAGQINNTDIQMLQEQMPSPEEEQAAQINQVQEMVIRFNVYDKIMNLDSKLELFIENFNEVGSGFYKDVQQVHEFIKVLNTLIFNLEINLVYQMYASLELQLIQLFEDYKDNQTDAQNGDFDIDKNEKEVTEEGGSN